MNEYLKFSWGHIIAFLALIAVSYFSFVGNTYLTDGDFKFALIAMSITDLVFIIFFIGAQQLKSSGRKIRRCMMWERFLVLGSPLIFIAGMVSVSHFWTVNSQSEEIVDTFTASINGAKQLFTDYEQYSEKRISDYSSHLSEIISAKEENPDTYRAAGFTEGKDACQKDNMIEVLRLQLLSQNFNTLRSEATNWIDEAGKGASTWNVFLLGNTRQIKQAILDWESRLKCFAANRMSNETLIAEVPDFTSDGAQTAIKGIESLTSAFTARKFPTISAIVFAVIIYMMLIFPYILQTRHSRSTYKNILQKRASHTGIKIDGKAKSSDDNKSKPNSPRPGVIRLD